MTTAMSAMTLSDRRDIGALRRLARQSAAACGLGPVQQAYVALAVSEAALSALDRGVGAIAEFRLADDDRRLEAVVQDGEATNEAFSVEAASAPRGQDLELARHAAEDLNVVREPEIGNVVTMGWARPSEAVTLRPDLTDPSEVRDRGTSPDLRELFEQEDRVLLEVLNLLSTSKAELEAQREQAAALGTELEATNRGVVALLGELEAAREAEARLAAIVRSSDDAMYSMTPERVLSTWNAGAERLLGYTATEIIGRTVDNLVPEVGSNELDAALKRLANGDHVAPYDTWQSRKDGSAIEITLTISAMRDPTDRLIGYSAVLRDLTDRRRAEEELAVARATEEVFAERDRIARDLHDLVIQRIFASGMALQATLTRARDPELSQRIQDVIDDLDATTVEIRSTIYALGQPPHQALTLRSEILDLSSEAAGSLGFAPRVRFEGPVDAAAPAGVDEHVRAVVREALSNVARHAQATNVEVSIQIAEDFILVVHDNGRGLEGVTRRSGLANLASRAEAMGGTFQVTSEVGNGTRMEWRVPLDI